MEKPKKERDLLKRLFNFSVNVIRFLKTVEKSTEANVIRYQLTKSATSSGANYEESQAASSNADFKHRVSIALREMRESNYWLRIIKELNMGKPKAAAYLVQESTELKKILGAIVSKV